MAKTPPSTILTEGFEGTSISVLPTTAHSRLSATRLPKCVTPRLPTYGCGLGTKLAENLIRRGLVTAKGNENGVLQSVALRNAELARIGRVTTMGELTASLAHTRSINRLPPRLPTPIPACAGSSTMTPILRRHVRLRRESSKTQPVLPRSSAGSACTLRRPLRNGSF